MGPHNYRVEVCVEGHWSSVGIFKAYTAAGALKQFAKDLHHFPAADGIRAEAV